MGLYPQNARLCAALAWRDRWVVGSEEASYLRRIDFVYHSTLGLRGIKKKKAARERGDLEAVAGVARPPELAARLFKDLKVTF